MLTYGTSHFVTKRAAIAYYRAMRCYDDPAGAVERELAEGEIHIGAPTVPAGQRLFLVDQNRRYAMSEA